MAEKKYSLLRVDGICPLYLEKRTYKCEMGNFTCEKCYTYGDTKEQLIKKVAQVMLRRFKKIYKGKFITVEMAEKQYLEVAKEIVEFLGVKE